MTKLGKFNAKLFHFRPSEADLRSWIEALPATRVNEFGGLSVPSRDVARAAVSTYIVTDAPEAHTDQSIRLAEADRLAKYQDDYLRETDVIVVDGVIGNDPKSRIQVRYMAPKQYPHLAAMLRLMLIQPVESGADLNWQPQLTVVQTPDLTAHDYPNEQVIAVDLENGITRIFGTDFVGEGRWALLRMWTKLTYDQGALPMHAACLMLPNDKGGMQSVLIVGAEGSGKSRLFFGDHGDRGAVLLNDDYIALYPDATVSIPEGGMFARVNGLSPKDTQVLYRAVTQPNVILSGASQDKNGKVDFGAGENKPVTHAIFPYKNLEGKVATLDGFKVERAKALFLLISDDGIIPPIAKLAPEWSSAYFMYGERPIFVSGTKKQPHQVMRIPGSNPLFPLLSAMQGNRLQEFLYTFPLDMYILNTGYVGGRGHDGAVAITPKLGLALIHAALAGGLEWKNDDDFNYQICAKLPIGVDLEIEALQPKRLYAKLGREGEYTDIVKRLTADRDTYLRRFPGLSPRIISPEA